MSKTFRFNSVLHGADAQLAHRSDRRPRRSRAAVKREWQRDVLENERLGVDPMFGFNVLSGGF